MLFTFFFQFSKTVICQAHLCPLPLHVEPIFWAYDNALRVYPLPDLIICADKYDPYSETQVECTVANPVSLNLFILLNLFIFLLVACYSPNVKIHSCRLCLGVCHLFLNISTGLGVLKI